MSIKDSKVNKQILLIFWSLAKWQIIIYSLQATSIDVENVAMNLEVNIT